jgi:hypothetical protein
VETLWTHNSQPVEKWKIGALPFALKRYSLLAHPFRFPLPSRKKKDSSGGSASKPKEVMAMKAPNRSFRVSSLSYHPADQNDYCVCRVLEECALVKIESLDKLHAAQKFMRRIAAHVPGSYVVFSHRTKRILGKVVSRAAA